MGTARVPFALYVISERKLAKRGLISACEEIVAACGVDAAKIAIQLREKDLGGRELLDLAHDLRRITRESGAMLMINDRIDVALACDADGVHLPVDSFGVRDARALLGKSRLIGCSTHSIAEVEAAGRAGADFVVFGPVFDPISKPSYGPAAGIEALQDVCEVSDLPVYALGGITAANIVELGDCECAGVATIGAVLGSESPGAAARAFLQAISNFP